MNIASPNLTLEAALAGIAAVFRDRLIKHYRGLKAAYSSGDHDACGLRTGQFCETLLRFLQQQLTGTHTLFGTRILNFDEECEKLEKTPKTAGPESLRVIIPRALALLYTLRNKRGIGHVGGDVDANEIDAATMVRVADWCLCELIRVVHQLPLEEAQAILDAISERQLPDVWSVIGKKRVLRTGLDYKSQTLLLLYSDPESAVAAEDLFSWTEHSNLSNYRRDVLRPLHTERLIEYDRETEMVILSPTGIARVEEKILRAGENGRAPTVQAKKRKGR